MNDSSTTLLKRTQAFLRSLVGLDDIDLDFGMYRFVRLKKSEIERFIVEDLPVVINNRFNEFQRGEQQERMLVTSFNAEVVERSVLEHLITFFSRYYVEGDFMSQRRFGGTDKYVIPHDGKEVVLYWVNKDQYYIKSTNWFTHYQFTLMDGFSVLFRTTMVEPSRGNDNKHAHRRFFFLADGGDENPITLHDNGVIEVRFHYRKPRSDEKELLGARPRQDHVNDIILDVLVSECHKILRVMEKGQLWSRLRAHLRRYTQKNERDYFIHKDLKGFLDHELDVYVKNEIMNLEADLHEIVTQKIIASIFKEIAGTIIDFLGQLEDFQRLTWEKKKFVLDTHYIITLDRLASMVGEDRLVSTIVPLLLENEQQLKEWADLLGENITSVRDLRLKSATSDEQGSKWKPLPIDTQWFDESFKWQLITMISRGGHLVDDNLDGLVFQGENWQVLNLLQAKFQRHIRTVYIDPPYNTGGDGFLYKDRFRHSSWLTMMADRLHLAKELMAPSSVIFVSIDDNELYRLKLLMDELFGESNYVETFLWTRTSTPPSLSKKSRTTTEYILCYERTLDPTLEYMGERTTKAGDQPLLNRGNPVRVLTFPPNVIRTFLPDGTYSPRKYERAELLTEIIVKDGLIITECKLRGEFKWSQEFLDNEIAKGTRFVIKSEKFAIRFIRPPERDGFIPPNKKIKEKYLIELDKKKTGIDTNDVATKELQDLGLEFTNPKPVSLIKYLCRFITGPNDYVLDFFAGSGTTGHAILSLNQEEGTRRKFILVDMGDCIQQVVLPRLKKVAYCKKWRKGIPQLSMPADIGGGLFLKYHSVESFEDSLENIVRSQEGTSNTMPSFRFYRHKRTSPTFLDVNRLKSPFNYQIKVISSSGQLKERRVDLVETFNYLMGLWVIRMFQKTWHGRNYIVVIGRHKDETVAVVWRNVENAADFFARDREFIEERVIKQFSPDVVYVNGDCAVENARSIDVVLTRLLLRSKQLDA